MKITGTIYQVEKTFSRMGNPSFTCIIIDNNNMETVFYTGANNCMGHTIQNHWREKVTVTLEYKRNKLTLIDLSL